MSTSRRSLSPTSATPSKTPVAGGFVSKLNDMVNGAPDEICSWVPSGEAFRINDMARLESETLPQYFRHNRFQSLVRQLNFYNFRKINRERNFWIYQHPLFHRDAPEEMYKLKRRSCPSAEARKSSGRSNKQQTRSATSPPSASITWSNDEEEDGEPGTLASSPNKVSRSPSPSSSPVDNPPAGRGSVRVRASLTTNTARRGSSQLKSVVSQESVLGRQKSDGKSYTSNDVVGSGNAEDYVVDRLNHHITKKARKAKQNGWSDYEDDSSTYSHKGFANEEDHDHLLVVADVSRDLNGICMDYAASIGQGGIRLGSAALPAFGLDKPHDHYYGVGKCDLFSYDTDDGFILDEVDEVKEECNLKEKKKLHDVTSSNIITKPKEEAPAVAVTPPSECLSVIQGITQACMEGKLIKSTSISELTLASAVLSFCLSTHPKDPNLANKIVVHLQKGPLVAREFDLYCEAMSPGFVVSASDDLIRYWKMYTMNYIRMLQNHSNSTCEHLSVSQNEVVKRCVTCWCEV